MATFIRNLVSKEKQRYQQDGFDLDLSYVTPRLIAMGYPSDKVEGIYRNPMSEVKRFFLAKHSGHYKVYNLCSERSYSPKHFANATASFPFDDHNPCPFYLLIQFCEDAKTYLDQSTKNVIAVHCKAGKGRTGLVLCCFLLFSKEQATAETALKFYGEARTKDGKGVTIPSQIRWVKHFEEYLKLYRWTSPARPFTAKGVPIVITAIEIHGYPYGLDPTFVAPCIRISLMQNKTLVWDSKVHAQWKSATGEVPRWIKGDTRPYIIACEVQVCGDYHITCTNNETSKIFGLWDHSTFQCADNADSKTTYTKEHLDGPSKDCKSHKKFPREFKVIVTCRPLKASEVVMAEPTENPDEKVEKKGIQVNNPIRKLVSKKKLRYQKDGFDLDLSYITPQIIAMGFPSVHLEGMYRNKMSDVQKFLKYYHDGHFKVYNLCSERTYTPDNFGNSTASYPFDDHNPCPFKTLVKFCEDASDFHGRDPINCAVVHCKAGKGRTGLVISALLLHEGKYPIAARALEVYGAARTSNVKGVTIPSQRRWVYYYQEYLERFHRVQRPFAFAGPTIRLLGFHMYPYPPFKGAGTTPNFKVSLMDKTVIYNHKNACDGKLVKWGSELQSWDCDISVELQGDVHVVFYDNNDKMFGFWIHTAFIHSESIEFDKEELDTAVNDKKHTLFPKDFKCQVFFGDVKVEETPKAALQTDARLRTHTVNLAPKPTGRKPQAVVVKTEEEEEDYDDGQEEGYSSPSEHELSDDEYPEEGDGESTEEVKKPPRVVELETQLAAAVKEQQWDKCIKIRDQIASLRCSCGGFFPDEQRKACTTCRSRPGGVLAPLPTTQPPPSLAANKYGTSSISSATSPQASMRVLKVDPNSPAKTPTVRSKTPNPTPTNPATPTGDKASGVKQPPPLPGRAGSAARGSTSEPRDTGGSVSVSASMSVSMSARESSSVMVTPRESVRDSSTSARESTLIPLPRESSVSAASPKTRPEGSTTSPPPIPGKLEHKVQPKPVAAADKISPDECQAFTSKGGTVWGGMPCAKCGVQYKLHKGTGGGAATPTAAGVSTIRPLPSATTPSKYR